VKNFHTGSVISYSRVKFQLRAGKDCLWSMACQGSDGQKRVSLGVISCVLGISLVGLVVGKVQEGQGRERHWCIPVGCSVVELGPAVL